MKKQWSLVLLSLVSFSLPAHHSQAANASGSNRTYAEVQAFLANLAKKSPSAAQVVNVGMNDTGQMIQALKTGNGPVANIVVATHHGNEYGSTEVALALAESLATSPITGQTVYVIPVLNVSGYNQKQRQELGQDPNRNYPGPCGTGGPFTLKSTKALADFIAQKNIVASATLHTHSPAVVYPWGFSTHDLETRYNGLYIDLAKAATVESGYDVGNSRDLLYAADGCYEDYAMVEHGIWSLLFELGTSHSPTASAVEHMKQVNVPGIRRFLTQAPTKRAEHHAFEGKCDTTRDGQRRRED